MTDSAPLRTPHPSADDEPDEPADGPRYDDESASAVLLRSTFCPREDWTCHDCPDCRQQYLTDDGVAAHWSDEHGGRWAADD
jgi:hypothetical protein